MGASVPGSSGDEAAEVLRLCESYLMLNERRLVLDTEIMAEETDDDERERLWVQLDGVLTESTDVLRHLAGARSSQTAAVRAKASILALVLRSPRTDHLDAAVAALALSVADDAAGLE